MNYCFDVPVNRRNTNSLKWNVAENELPMWVADMDFQTAPEIQKAISARAKSGIFGYTDIPNAWHEAYINWWKTRHNFLIEKEWLVFCTGVVPAISSIIRKLTSPAEKVLVQTPVYNIFFNCILNNGRQALQSPLIYENGTYNIDFESLEHDLADPETALMILCNPHNPVGRIWSREELEKIGELCFKHNVTVISDEIHCDITDIGCVYTPFASVSRQCRDISITCVSPTKAFNLAGLQTSAVFAADKNLRHKVWRALNTDEIAEPNAFAIDAAVAAFNHGALWQNELRAYLQQNKEYAAGYIKNKIPQIKAVPSQATYLLWLDCTALPCPPAEASSTIRRESGLVLSQGGQFGRSGESFLRMNAACPRTVLQDGLCRLKKGIEAIVSNY